MNPIVKRGRVLAALKKGLPTTVAARPIVLITCSELGSGKLPFSLHPESNIIQNFGNTIYLPNGQTTAELASLEFALRMNGIKDIVLLGHTSCAAMRYLVHPEEWSVPELECSQALEKFRNETGELLNYLKNDYSDKSMEGKVNSACQEHLLIQAEKLSSLPLVKETETNIFSWVIKDEQEKLYSYQPETGQFQ